MSDERLLAESDETTSVRAMPCLCFAAPPGYTTEETREIESVVRPTADHTGEPPPETPSTRELADRLGALTSRVDGLAAALEQLRRPDTAALSPATTDAQLLSMLFERGLDVRDVLRTACLRHRQRSWVPKDHATPAASAVDYLRGWSLELDPDNAKQPAALPFVELLRTIALVRDNFGVMCSRDELPELIKREAAALNGQGFSYHTAVPLVQRARLYSTFLRQDISDLPCDDPSDVLTIARRAKAFTTPTTK